MRSGSTQDREAVVLALLDRSFTGAGILVFTAKKSQAHRIAILLGLAGLNATELHGNLTQRQRLEALEHFRTGAADILVATDLAGRGLDISGVRVVINDEMPRDLSTYVHRVGRTARAGRAGVSVTLVSESSRPLMKEVVKRAALNVRARTVPSDVIHAYRTRIAAMEDDVARVIFAERNEREIRIAETQVNKASNILEHEAEISSRPKRTWFATEKEKAATRAASAAAARGDVAGVIAEKEAPPEKSADKDNKHRLTRKKRRRLAAIEGVSKEARHVERLERDAEDARQAAGDDDDDGADRPVDPELRAAKKHATRMKKATFNQGRIARSAKKSARAKSVGLAMSLGKATHVSSKIAKRKAQAARK